MNDSRGIAVGLTRCSRQNLVNLKHKLGDWELLYLLTNTTTMPKTHPLTWRKKQQQKNSAIDYILANQKRALIN